MCIRDRDYEPYARERDQDIIKMCDEKSVSCHSFKDHVVFEEDEIIKNDGTPYVVYTPYSKKWLEKYLYQSRQIISNRKSSEQKFVFLSNNGKRLTRAAIWQSIKKYVKAAGIVKTVSPHTFRHSFATHLVDGGANLIEIQNLLGHSDISTTEIYVHLSKEFIDSEYMKAFDKKKN